MESLGQKVCFMAEYFLPDGNKLARLPCAWSNIRSARNAIKSGFLPAWVEMTVKPKNLVDEMNR